MRKGPIVLVVLAMALALPACGSKTPKPGKPASIEDISPAGFEAKLASFRGKPLVVNFWATWCDPCKAELPRLAAAAKHYAGRIAFLGVDVQDDSGIAARFASRSNVTYQSVADPRRAVVQSQRIIGLPVTQFYDASGKRVVVHQGEIKQDELNKQIRRLLRG